MSRNPATVIIAIAFTLAATPVLAQRIPPGTYQQSCTNIRVYGSTVTANCSASNGRRITSSTSTSCRGDIGNVDGYLRCNGGGHYNSGHGLPHGSYQQSCTNARMNGTILYASCPSGSGQRIHSSLDTRSCRRGADIANRNGYLRCER